MGKSNMFECDLQFPHAYEVNECPELPGSGQSDLDLHYFPPPRARSEHDGLWLEVCPRSGQKWLGVFAHGYVSPSAISRVLSTPHPTYVCVISSGQAYIVNTCDPQEWSIVHVIPVTDARSLPQHQILLFVGFSSVTAWGRDGKVWQAQFPVDGITLTEVTPWLIEGFGYNPAEGGDTSFEIDTKTGRILRRPCGKPSALGSRKKR